MIQRIERLQGVIWSTVLQEARGAKKRRGEREEGSRLGGWGTGATVEPIDTQRKTVSAPAHGGEGRMSKEYTKGGEFRIARSRRKEDLVTNQY